MLVYSTKEDIFRIYPFLKAEKTTIFTPHDGSGEVCKGTVVNMTNMKPIYLNPTWSSAWKRKSDAFFWKQIKECRGKSYLGR